MLRKLFTQQQDAFQRTTPGRIVAKQRKLFPMSVDGYLGILVDNVAVFQLLKGAVHY